MIINYLCYFNMMFFVADIVKMIFLKKIGRTFNFPTIGICSNFLLFGTSVYMSYWIENSIMKDISYPGISDEDMRERKWANFVENILFSYEYLFAIMIACLITKNFELLLYSSNIGPLA